MKGAIVLDEEEYKIIRDYRKKKGEEVCEVCLGDGIMTPCPRCGGSGKVKKTKRRMPW